MKNFNWEEFKDKNNRIAVHCKTEGEAKDFCKKMHEHGLKWIDGDSYMEKTNYGAYPGTSCYYADGKCSGLGYAEEKGYKILEWSDYMKKEFTKADLKDGMVVEQKNKIRYLFLGNRLLRIGFHDTLNCYSDKLENTIFEENTITKVFIVKNDNVGRLEEIFFDKNLELIWERTEPKKMTAEEMRKKLEELTGEKIEVDLSIEEMVGVIYKYCRKNKCSECVIPSNEIGCNIFNYSNAEVKKAYEKVMEDE